MNWKERYHNPNVGEWAVVETKKGLAIIGSDCGSKYANNYLSNGEYALYVSAINYKFSDYTNVEYLLNRIYENYINGDFFNKTDILRKATDEELKIIETRGVKLE